MIILQADIEDSIPDEKKMYIKGILRDGTSVFINDCLWSVHFYFTLVVKEAFSCKSEVISNEFDVNELV